MTYEEAIQLASGDESFKARLHAINTLLVKKGVYTQKEFQQLFIEWVEKAKSQKTHVKDVGSREATFSHTRSGQLGRLF